MQRSNCAAVTGVLLSSGVGTTPASSRYPTVRASPQDTAVCKRRPPGNEQVRGLRTPHARVPLVCALATGVPRCPSRMPGHHAATAKRDLFLALPLHSRPVRQAMDASIVPQATEQSVAQGARVCRVNRCEYESVSDSRTPRLSPPSQPSPDLPQPDGRRRGSRRPSWWQWRANWPQCCCAVLG